MSTWNSLYDDDDIDPNVSRCETCAEPQEFGWEPKDGMCDGCDEACVLCCEPRGLHSGLRTCLTIKGCFTPADRMTEPERWNLYYALEAWRDVWMRRYSLNYRLEELQKHFKRMQKRHESLVSERVCSL